VKVHSGHKASAVLDILNAGTTNGSLLQLYDCNGRPNQQWAIESGGEIVNPASGRCLTDPGNSTTDYTQIEIYDCSGASGPGVDVVRQPGPVRDRRPVPGPLL
jgi:hypothetical protein